MPLVQGAEGRHEPRFTRAASAPVLEKVGDALDDVHAS
jgi:hypothetical protein